MLTRYKGIVFAVVLGLICPAVMIAMLQKEKPTVQNTIPEDTRRADRAETATLQISVLMPSGKIEAMDMNDYLTCVVLREMPANFELEALKAQAVVARTYALRRSESGGKHDGAAVCANSDCCQGYYDVEEYIADKGLEENVDKIRNAVYLTENLVLVYNGRLIDATYFSCSGGMTEDAAAVWGKDVPYLQSTASPGEEGATHFVDTETYTLAEFKRLLDIESSNNVQVGNITYTSGGGVNTINVCGTTFKGTEFRQRLGLRSTAFVITVISDAVIITTKGYGHRVGMSQYGADAMAVGGADFPDILAHYYQGTQLVTYNGN